MAEDAANHIKYTLVIKEEDKDNLSAIRGWSSLKIAFDQKMIWVKDFDYVQINSLEVKSIPYKTVYYEKEGKLFLFNSLLPERNIPALLWTPIERGLPVALPSFNHNYFGVHEKLSLNLVPSEKAAEAEIMIADITDLQAFLEKAPAVRLQNLAWLLWGEDKAIIKGRPFLPVRGEAYWLRNDFVMPTGYDFDLFILADALNHKLNPDKNFLIIWNKDNSCFGVKKSDFQPLSLSSFRATMQNPAFF